VDNSKYGKYIITELNAPHFTPEYNAEYAKFATRILWMDSHVVEGAFQMNCSWYRAPKTFLDKGHIHNSDELIGFFGSNPEDPHNLQGEVEFWIEDEKFMLTKSTMIFVPKGIKHCPLVVRRVDSPIFHFSVCLEGEYVKKDIPD
jgi:hypothetical protein